MIQLGKLISGLLIITFLASCNSWSNQRNIVIDLIEDAPRAIKKHSQFLDIDPAALEEIRKGTGPYVNFFKIFGHEYKLSTRDGKDQKGLEYLSIFAQNKALQTIEFQFIKYDAEMKLMFIVLPGF